MSRGLWKSSFSPESRGAVVEYCGKYTVGQGVGRDSRPGYRPRSCGDRAGVLPAPAGGVVVTVGRTGLQMWRSVGPTGRGPACSSGGGVRSGPGPPRRSAGVHARRSGRHVEVPDPTRREIRDSGYE